MNTLHPDMQTLIDARSDLPAAVTIEDERRNWTTYSQRLAQPAPADMVVEDRELPTSVRAVPVRVYRPAALRDVAESPCVVYLHGGGLRKAA